MSQAITPYAFLPYQQRWAADTSQVKVMEKSRRIGLSWSEAADDSLFSAETGGSDVWYIGYNKEMAEEFIGDCADWVKKYQLAAGAVEEELLADEDKDILTFRIKFASGHKIVALSSRPSNLRGKAGRVVIDEAAFHDDLKELIKAAIALLMWGGQVRIISTHNGDANPFNELINDIRAGRTPYTLHRVTLDDALADGLYQRICLTLGRPWSVEAETKWRNDLVKFYGDAAQEELFCIPAQGSGTYLTRAMIEGCMSADIQVIRYEQTNEFAERDDIHRQSVVEAWCEETLLPLLADLEPKRQTVLGEDFARSGDLTIMIPAQEQQDSTWRAIFTLELRNIPFRQQEQICFYIIDHLPRFKHGAFDARGNGQYLAEVAMQKYGATRISQVMLSETWYRENMPKYKAAFEDRSWLLPKDADVIEDHRAFKLIKGVARLPETKNTGSDNKKRHGDSGIAGALTWFATWQEGEIEYDYHQVKKRETFSAGNPLGYINNTAGFGRERGAW
jgi:phage FluMu gp28-like protein